jgi:hypothetical protein
MREIRNSYKIFDRKTEGKRPLGRPTYIVGRIIFDLILEK